MGSVTWHLEGAKLSGNTLMGVVKSEEILRDFRPKNLFNWYQRERVSSPKKIKALQEVFSSYTDIPPITINVVGSARVGKRSITLTGDIHVLDGQQRLMALSETGVCDYMVPVVAYTNLSEAQEVEMFQGRNTGASPLSTAELAKSVDTRWGDQFRKVLASRSYPVNVTLRKSNSGISAAIWFNMMLTIHGKLYGNDIPCSLKGGRRILDFMKQDSPAYEVQSTNYGVQNILKHYVKTFGYYDSRSIPWQRTFINAWTYIMAKHFMDEVGNVVIPRVFTIKFKPATLSSLSSSSYIREHIGSGEYSFRAIIDEMVRYFNKGRKTSFITNYAEDTITQGKLSSATNPPGGSLTVLPMTPISTPTPLQ